MSAALPTLRVLRYGALGLPLAFAALPIYVHVPRLYAEGFGLSLARIGAILLVTRIVDALADPLIGWAADRVMARRRMIALALPLLALGLIGLLAPPAGAGGAWLAAMLILVTVAYSVATINYAAWGVELGMDADSRRRLVASREGFALAGVVLAAALPALFSRDLASALARLAWLSVPLLVLAALLSLSLAGGAGRITRRLAPWRALCAALTDAPFAALLAVFALSGVAAALPASTVLFFIADVIEREDLAGVYLALYFCAGAAGLPLWIALARRIGALRAWLLGMGLSIMVFGWAASLGAGATFAYGLLCIVSGLALGADLALPPALLAEILMRHSAPGSGACFGWWTFVSKASLALAAGLALPLLDAMGYAPGARGAAAVMALSAVYALLPVVLKLAAAAALWRLRHLIDMEKET